MKIYTKTGDKGTTSLVGGQRTAKDDPRVEAYGTVDELSAFTAYLRDSLDPAEPDLEEFRDDLRQVLSTLMSVEAVLAGAGCGKDFTVAPAHTSFLEERIDHIDALLKPVMMFTIPGGHPTVSLCHVCRTVCRRAERTAVRAAHDFEFDPNAVVYLNRLSDYFYSLGRRLSDILGVEEEYWRPEA